MSAFLIEPTLGSVGSIRAQPQTTLSRVRLYTCRTDGCILLNICRSSGHVRRFQFRITLNHGAGQLAHCSSYIPFINLELRITGRNRCNRQPVAHLCDDARRQHMYKMYAALVTDPEAIGRRARVTHVLHSIWNLML